MAVEIAFAVNRTKKAPSSNPTFCRDALHDPNIRSQLCDGPRQLPLPPWQLDVDRHTNFVGVSFDAEMICGNHVSNIGITICAKSRDRSDP